MKRFYKSAGFEKSDEGFFIQLDGKTVKTPLGAMLLSPSQALAEAVVAEWEAQNEKIVPRSMPLTQLLNTAIDKIAVDKGVVVAKLLEYAGSDTVCYYASSPDDLVRRQARCWGDLTDWLADEAGIRLVVTAGIAHADQPEGVFKAWKALLDAFDDMALTAFQAAVSSLGSVCVAYAVIAGRYSPQEALEAACLEELYQAEKWGMDPETQRRHESILDDVAAAKRFYDLTR